MASSTASTGEDWRKKCVRCDGWMFADEETADGSPAEWCVNCRYKGQPWKRRLNKKVNKLEQGGGQGFSRW